ncbi:MAG: DUF3786 domain-containing protein [Candidatus Thorarchaeota archaeon]
MKFLKYRLSLEDGHLFDELKGRYFLGNTSGIYCLLSGYAHSVEESPETGEMLSFAQLHGGRAFQRAFVERAVRPIAGKFGADSRMLREAASLLDGRQLEYGDCSFRIQSLPRVPIFIILHEASEEFSAHCSLLFDSSTNHYLSTEEASILGALTTGRLIAAAAELQTKTRNLA